MDRKKALQQTVLFRNLSDPDLEALASRCLEQTLRKGEILFMAGDTSKGLYVVVSGIVRAYRVSSDGREQVIHVERAGATLAEVPVFDEGPYPSTVSAETDAELLLIRTEDVRQLCLQRPNVSLAALNLLAGRLRQCAAKVESLSLRDVDRRVAQWLLEECENRTQSMAKTVTLELNVTHQQIAARVGSVREVVSRAFQRLQQSGLIRIEGRQVVIPDMITLRDYASE